MKRFSSAFAAAVLIFALSSAVVANASTPLSGWAWSSNLGWISFNSANSGSGGGPYSVSVATTSASTVGTLSGWAWTPNGGWISFNASDTAGCPTIESGSLNGCTASVDLSSGNVTGWARVSNGVGANGWDGWMELSGPSHATGDATGQSGVTYITSGSSTGEFVGFAWGGPVTGWVKFNPSIPVVITGTIGATTTPTTNLPTVTSCTYSPASPENIPNGQTSVSITVTATNVEEVGYSGTFSYVWSDGTTQQIIATGSGAALGSSLSQVYTYSAATGGIPSTPQIKLTDASGNNATISCGNVTVTDSNAAASTGLWPDQLSPAYTGSTAGVVPAQNTLNNLPPVRILPGSNLQMDYVWDPSVYARCLGHVKSGPAGWNTSSWASSWSNIDLTSTLKSNFNGIGSTVLPSLPTGIYQLNLLCYAAPVGLNNSHSLMAAIENFFLADNGTPSPNTVEIDVVPSSEQEI